MKSTKKFAISGIETDLSGTFKKQPDQGHAVGYPIMDPGHQQSSSGWQQPGAVPFVAAPAGSRGTLTIAVVAVLETGCPNPRGRRGQNNAPPNRKVGAFGVYSEQSDLLQFGKAKLGFQRNAGRVDILKHLEILAVLTVVRKLQASDQNRREIVTSHSKVRLLVNNSSLLEVVNQWKKREFVWMRRSLQAPHALAREVFFGVPVELEAATTADDQRYHT